MADQNAMIETQSKISRDASTSSTESRGASVFKGRFRWAICGLLFFGVTKNYMDRQVLGILSPTLQHSIGWTEAQYGYIIAAFQVAFLIAAATNLLALWPALSVRDEQARSTVPASRRA